MKVDIFSRYAVGDPSDLLATPSLVEGRLELSIVEDAQCGIKVWLTLNGEVDTVTTLTLNDPSIEYTDVTTYSVTAVEFAPVASGTPKYNGIFGRVSYLEFSEIASPVPLDLDAGCYVDYARTGIRYKTYTDVAVSRQARTNEAGDSFLYKNVKFYAPTRDIELALFHDLVLYDNTLHFSSAGNVSTFENVYGIADRLQANLDNAYGEGVWKINVVEEDEPSEVTELMQEVREFSLQDGTCLDALNQIYNVWKGIGWIYTYDESLAVPNVITIGRPNIQDSDNTLGSVFSYGLGHGLKVLTRNLSSQNDFATRLYVYGSDRNMPTRYYNNSDYDIKEKLSVHIPNLMIPVEQWGETDGQYDASKAYLEDADAVAQYGVIPKIVRFDGSNERAEIHPSIEGMDVPAGHGFTGRADEVVSCANPTDDGLYTEVEGSKRIVKLEKALIAPTETVAGDKQTAQIVKGQQHLTLYRGESLFSTGSVGAGTYRMTFAGNRYVSSVYAVMNGEEIAIGKYLKSAALITYDFYVGNELVNTKTFQFVRDSNSNGTRIFAFPEDIVFTTEQGGALRVEEKIGLDLIPNTPAMTVVKETVQDTKLVLTVDTAIDTTFKITLKNIGFDISAMGSDLTDGVGTIAMKTGMCAGREFVIKKCETWISEDMQQDGYILTCQRSEDTSLSQWFPNTTFPIEADDRFVILDIQMPNNYVEAAEERLLAEGQKALESLSKVKRAYVPDVDSKIIAISEINLVEGLYMPLEDEDIIGSDDAFILIDSVIIDESTGVIPEYKVTLRDEKAENIVQKLTGELGNANKLITDLQQKPKRRPVRDNNDGSGGDSSRSVHIVTDSPYFPPNSVDADTKALSAVTSGIGTPVFRWKRYNGSTSQWVAIAGEDKAVLEVAYGSTFFSEDGRLKIKVEVYTSVPEEGDEPIAEDSVELSKILNGRGINNAVVRLFKRGRSVSAVLPKPEGYFEYSFIDGSIEPLDDADLNGWTIDIPSSSAVWQTYVDLPEDEGTATILSEDWSAVERYADPVAPAEGYIRIYIYILGSIAPSVPSADLTYTYATGELSPSSALDGWSRNVPSVDTRSESIWTISQYVQSNETTAVIDGDDFSDPALYTESGEPGEDGTSVATEYLYKRGNAMPTVAPGDLTFTFATGLLSGSAFNGWLQDIPSPGSELITEPVWMISARVVGNGATANVKGGFYDETPAGDWSRPTRLTGDNGLKGKVMRGINEFSEDGLEDGRVTEDGYQGLDEVDTSFEFYDVVYLESTSEGVTTMNYYYCKMGKVGDVYAQDVNPAEDTQHTYWVPATQFEFVATKVLIASNAFIDVFGGNAAYMYGNGGSDEGKIVAGMQGGSDDGQGTPVVNFFAGRTQNTDIPNTAYFRVYSDGTMVATKGQFGNLILGTDPWSSRSVAQSHYTDAVVDVHHDFYLDAEAFRISASDGDDNSESVVIAPIRNSDRFDLPATFNVFGTSYFGGLIKTKEGQEEGVEIGEDEILVGGGQGGSKTRITSNGISINNNPVIVGASSVTGVSAPKRIELVSEDPQVEENGVLYIKI
jgi:hypothetical protein